MMDMRVFVRFVGLLCGAGAIVLTIFCVSVLYHARADDRNVYQTPYYHATIPAPMHR
jgi:hypothetical protein